MLAWRSIDPYFLPQGIHQNRLTSTMGKRHLILAATLVCVLSYGAVAPVSAWTLHRQGVAPVTLPTRPHGEIALMDLLAVADLLDIHHQVDIDGEQVFFFPETPVVVVAYGTFVKVGSKTLHLPVPVEFTEENVWVAQPFVLELLRDHAPGTVTLQPGLRRVLYQPPPTDLLSIAGRTGEEGTVVFRVVATKPLEAEVQLLDSTTVGLRFDAARLAPQHTTVTLEDSLPADVTWNLAGRGVMIQTAFPLGGVKLQGPDRGNVFELELSPLDESDDPLAYDERTVYEELEQARREWEIDVIVIDPGHGGKDPGAIGPNNVYEKDIVLDIGLRLRDFLTKKLGVKVVMTRDDDTFVPLHERTRIANNSGGKLFVSLHCNAARSRAAHGSETYFLAPARTERAMKVAMKENSVIKYEESQEGYVDLTEENYILLAMAQAQFVKESEVFASMIQDKLSSSGKVHNRGVDQAGFYVLIGASMPAVLVETAFISNVREENLLTTPEFRQQVAEQISEAIKVFMAMNME